MPKPSVVQGVVVTNPLSGFDLDIFWQQNPETDIAGYNIYRSIGPETGFIKINSSLITILSFRDVAAIQQSRTDYWYYVTAVSTDAQESNPSLAVVNELRATSVNRNDLDRIGDGSEMNHEVILREIVRRNELLIRRGGERVDIYIRKTSGTRCDCFDPLRVQSTDPRCSDCFGTTFKGGYEPVRNILMKIMPTSRRLELTELGLTLTLDPRAWVTTFPIIRTGDVVVRRINNERFQVREVTAQISRGIMTRQEFTLVTLLRTEFPEIYALV